MPEDRVKLLVVVAEPICKPLRLAKLLIVKPANEPVETQLTPDRLPLHVNALLNEVL